MNESRTLRIVIDNNVLVSQFLLPDSVPGQAFQKAYRHHTLVSSLPLLVELAEVLSRKKFDGYATRAEREEFLKNISLTAVLVETPTRVSACRDPKDNQVLEAAVNGDAQIIITGDQDLLNLDPFHGIRILRPADYLQLEN